MVGQPKANRWDLGNWASGDSGVSLFQALGVKKGTISFPRLQTRLTSPAAQAAPPPGSSGSNSANPATGQLNTKGLKNPIGAGLVPSRVDMGVDYTGAGPLYAIGDGTIVNVYNSGWPGGTFIGLKLTSGQYVYYAENISPQVRVNQSVKAGQLIGYANGSYPFVEVGWAAPPGTGQTMAAASGQNKAGLAKGDPGYYPTGFGVAFNNLLKSLGARPGNVSGSVQGSVPSGYS